MGLSEDLWKRHSKRALGVEVRGKTFLELRKWHGTNIMLNIQAREADIEELEKEIMKEWGAATMGYMIRTRELLLTEVGRRDMIVPCYDNVDETIPLSCISLLHVLMIPEQRLASKWQFQMNAYARSIHVDRLNRDLEFLMDVMAWFLYPMEDFYWEDYDPVLSLNIASLHKEVVR